MISRFLILILSLFFLSACNSLSYYSQAVDGQLDMLSKRKPIEKLLAQDDLNPDLRNKLELVQQVREFASSRLHLPVDKSYSTYADLERDFAVWNVYAAPALSVEAYEWCFMIVGCVAYKGYFDREKAIEESEELQQQGYDAFVGGVAAYSTLGWFNDPVLNTFLYKEDASLVEVLIHEIAHRQIFVKGDTTFNESFATAVADLGMDLWYSGKETQVELDDYRRSLSNVNTVKQHVMSYRSALETIYLDDQISDKEKLAGKEELFKEMRETYQQIKIERNLDDRFDEWVSSINNAHMATLANYNVWVPAFKRLYSQAGSFPGFYEKVEALAQLSEEERKIKMESLLVD